MEGTYKHKILRDEGRAGRKGAGGGNPWARVALKTCTVRPTHSEQTRPAANVRCSAHTLRTNQTGCKRALFGPHIPNKTDWL